MPTVNESPGQIEGLMNISGAGNMLRSVLTVESQPLDAVRISVYGPAMV